MIVRSHRLKKPVGDLIALLSGAALALAFAPFEFSYLAIAAPALLLATWLTTTPRRAAWRGFLFGIGLFSVGVSWIYISIHIYGNSPLWLAIIITILFIAFLSSFFAAFGYGLQRFFTPGSAGLILMAYPSGWVLLEWVRGWIMTGFPWLLLGYTQASTPLKGLAPLIGVYGLSFVLVFTSSVIISCFTLRNFRINILALLLVLLFWGSGALLTEHQWTAPAGKPLRVSLIQGNVPQELKWQPSQIDTILADYYRLTQQHWNSQIIVWPEAAVTITNDAAANYLQQLAAQAKQNNTSIIMGIPIAMNERYYNGMITIGNGSGMYLKRHLVPFGEFMPLRSVLNFLSQYILIPMSDFSSGPQQQTAPIANGITIAPFICYEILYQNEVLPAFPAAQLIVVVTDDSWFGKSFAAAQHLQMAQLRALETGRSVLFATNNGITAIIDAYGNLTGVLPERQQAVLSALVQPMNGSTPLVYYRNYPILFGLFACLMIAFWQARRGVKKNILEANEF